LRGYYSEGDGSGWRLARSLITLAREAEQAFPDVTCLGTVGDTRHAGQGLGSDHNPFVTDPATGVGVVRAIDLGGPHEQLLALRTRLYELGTARFGPLWQFGFLKGPDSTGCNWPIGTGWNHQTGDEGHLHVSVTQANGWNPVAGPSGYLAAIDSTTSWGIVAAPNDTSTPPIEEDDGMRAFLVKDGGGQCWVVAGDWSTRTPITEQTYAALNASGRYDGNPGVDHTSLSAIPIAGRTFAAKARSSARRQAAAAWQGAAALRGRRR